MTSTTRITTPAALEHRTVAVIGYGSQGSAHAKNLRDSGVRVIVGLRPGGPTEAKAKAEGFEVREPAEAVRAADLVAVLVPDMAQPQLYQQQIAPNLKAGACLLFAHGFNVHYGQINPRHDIDVVLVAPKGPGALVRREFEIGRGVPSVYAVHQDQSGEAEAIALAYCAGIGGGRAQPIRTTFKEETETDLFGEQAVLCGGATKLVMAGWETLVEAGYQPEIAYYECLHELKLIVDLLYEGGITQMHRFISETAQYGDLTRGPYVVDEHTRTQMKRVLAEIQDGRFAREWIAEYRAGNPNYRALKQADLEHPIEAVGRKLRAAMPWLQPRGEAPANPPATAASTTASPQAKPAEASA
ncbi:ketol-acid reductoisomerase [Silanimonas lenta]|uniref:ketol-acid reductoisomerase n=1 Tax=Silanimonas lenta TaxID=265429 RepID=UPI0004070FBA|nr:ketol-acid reductoisomerase [Silanimonas lenta]